MHAQQTNETEKIKIKCWNKNEKKWKKRRREDLTRNARPSLSTFTWSCLCSLPFLSNVDAIYESTTIDRNEQEKNAILIPSSDFNGDCALRPNRQSNQMLFTHFNDGMFLSVLFNSIFHFSFLHSLLALRLNSRIGRQSNAISIECTIWFIHVAIDTRNHLCLRSTFYCHQKREENYSERVASVCPSCVVNWSKLILILFSTFFVHSTSASLLLRCFIFLFSFVAIDERFAFMFSALFRVFMFRVCKLCH